MRFYGELSEMTDDKIVAAVPRQLERLGLGAARARKVRAFRDAIDGLARERRRHDRVERRQRARRREPACWRQHPLRQAGARDAEASKALVDYLRTPEAVAVIKAKGMEPAVR